MVENLVIFDTKAIQFVIADAALSKKIHTPHQLQQYTHLNVLYLLSGAWLHDKTPCRYIFVNDSKPYWRHYELNDRYGVNYKGNRKKDSKRDMQATVTGSCLEEVLGSLGLLTLQFAEYKTFSGVDFQLGYEADDLAAFLVQTMVNRFNRIYLLTVDTDWLPLCYYKNVTWINLNSGSPRIRDKETGLAWFQKSSSVNTVEKRQYASRMTCIKDIWKFKAYYGDSSDNLRGNKKDQAVGKYDPYIDLFNPLPPYNLMENSKFKQLLTSKAPYLFTKLQTPIAIKQWQLQTKDTPPVAILPLSDTDKLPYSA